MLNLMLESGDSGPMSVLCVGAHCDDIEIGCGGTLLLLGAHENVSITWVIFSSTSTRAQEARDSAAAFLGQGEGRRVIIKEYRDGFLPYSGAAVKDEFEALKTELNPDLVFTHFRHDLHQDHRLISELTWNTFRDHFILEYEIPKYDGDIGNPDTYVALPEDICAGKASRLVASYRSQASRPWFTSEVFMSLMRIRGMEINAPSGFAEAFYARKASLVLPQG